MADQRISGASTSPRSESDVRLNYGDPTRVIAASNDIGSSQAQYFSTNGGATWGPTSNLPLTSTDTSQSDPAVDWTSDGLAWALTIGVAGATLRLRCYQSTTNGQTWTFNSTVSGTQTGADREIIWVDHSSTSPFRDQIYATWHNGTPVFFARRTTGAAAAWQAPIQISGTETTVMGIGGDIKTNSFGDVFVFWPDTGGSRRILVVKSTNGGVTFTPPITIATTFASQRQLFIPADAVRGARVYVSAGAYRTAAKDLVYAVWTDLTGATGCTTGGGPGTTATSTCKTRVWFSRSTNGGINWSAPAMLNNPTSLNDQFHAKLSVDESNGNLLVTYQDTVNDTNRLQTDVFMLTSTDDGVTWSTPVRITSARSDETTAGADSNQYGDYNGLSGFFGTFFPTWTDRRAGGTEETWTSRIDFVPKRCYLIVDKSSFGEDEVDALLQAGNATVDAAFYVVVDGFSAAELGVTVADLSGTPGLRPTLTSAPTVSGMTIGQPTRLIAEDPSLPAFPQRFTWVYPVSFANSSGFTQQILNVTISASLAGVSGAGIIRLLQQPNPYELDGQTAWLSTDLRVFQIRAGESRFGATVAGGTATNATAFIQQVISNLNSGNTAGDTFEGTLDPNQTGIALFQNDSTGTAVFNYAIAKVRYRALVQDAGAVRVFFRLFPALTVSLAYDSSTTYRLFSDGAPSGKKIPFLGRQSNNILSIPCFATPRVTPGANMMTQNDTPNVQTILHNVTGSEVVRYFGCWLDTNQPGMAHFPLNPTNDGPFAGSLRSVLELIRNQHQCLVSEIVFDPDPIASGATPTSSDKLAQRNLTLVASANPGDPASRRIPNAFELKPTQIKSERPDELMIDWGNTPAGSVARIYLPAVSADDILELAAKQYSRTNFRRADENTIECDVAGITYMPIPPAPDLEHAGILTVDLPAGVRAGDSYAIVVRQLTRGPRVPPITEGPVIDVAAADALTAAADLANVVDKRPESRRVLGTFQISIPVQAMASLLEPEERLLAVLRWILQSIPDRDRWQKAFQRYVDEIANRVRGLGGDPTQIQPSPTGELLPTPRAVEQLSWSGKITELRYDRFGDFQGFILDTEQGDRLFSSREHQIEDLAERAWTQRISITVLAARHEPQRPLSIIFRHAPRPFQG